MNTDNVLQQLGESNYTGYELEPKYWESAKPTAEAADAVKLNVKRLLELADRRLVPHYRVDDSGPFFHIPTFKRWIAVNLVETIQGVDIPLVTVQQVINSDSLADVKEVPENLRAIVGLRRANIEPKCSGIYFLCEGTECVYVGQSTNIYTRVGQHVDKKFDRVYYILVDQVNLIAIEAQLIAALTPKYNNCGTARRAKKCLSTAISESFNTLDQLTIPKNHDESVIIK